MGSVQCAEMVGGGAGGAAPGCGWPGWRSPREGRAAGGLEGQAELTMKKLSPQFVPCASRDEMQGTCCQPLLHVASAKAPGSPTAPRSLSTERRGLIANEVATTGARMRTKRREWVSLTKPALATAERACVPAIHVEARK